MNMNDVLKWIVDNRERVFDWGECDCCTFTCDFVKHMTGIDPAEAHRGHYDTEIGAKRAISKYGSVEDSFDKHFDRVTVNQAMRGDAVLFNSEMGKTLGIKWSGGVLAITSDGVTLHDVSPDDIITVWRIIE